MSKEELSRTHLNPMDSSASDLDTQNDPFLTYEHQISHVKTLLNGNPDLMDVLDAQEKALFQEYFLPDWEVEGHFVRYYHKILKQKPDLPQQANTLLEKFLVLNDLSLEYGLIRNR